MQRERSSRLYCYCVSGADDAWTFYCVMCLPALARKWVSFTSSARSDGAAFEHWQKDDKESGDYAYARWGGQRWNRYNYVTLPLIYSCITAPLNRYLEVSLVSLYRYSTITLPLLCRYFTVALPLHFSFFEVSLALLCRYSTVTVPLFYRFFVVTFQLLLCYFSVA